MSVKSDIPQISLLRQEVESRFGKALRVHADFLALVSEIESQQREHISESTLERVWGYSTRGYDSISLRTLDVLSHYARGVVWSDFCKAIKEDSERESEFFGVPTIQSCDLKEGDLVRIGWLPDRICVIRYLGNNRYQAVECENSTMQPGDTFSCLHFYLGRELVMAQFQRSNEQEKEPSDNCYVVGQRNGLTLLQHVK